MSQTNTNTNTGASNTIRNQITRRGGRTKEALAVEAVAVAEAIAETTQSLNIFFEGKMKDGCISKLTITKTGHRATQYKKIIDILPILSADKNFRYIHDILHT